MEYTALYIVRDDGDGELVMIFFNECSIECGDILTNALEDLRGKFKMQGMETFTIFDKSADFPEIYSK